MENPSVDFKCDFSLSRTKINLHSSVCKKKSLNLFLIYLDYKSNSTSHQNVTKILLSNNSIKIIKFVLDYKTYETSYYFIS
jgi:hypothetical protein